ncbi:MAG: guanylate kinase [Candidatus Omnitrophica bacterium]|nr:guanylate kinase [Candidatus Omnitrophota bacterium]
MARKGILFVVSAPSGSGKTTLCQRLIKDFSGKRVLVPSVSVTTRKPRKGERHGEDYFFISKPEFLRRRRSGQFLEWAKVLDNFYGTPKDFIRLHVGQGTDVLLNIDVQGALKIKRMLRRSGSSSLCRKGKKGRGYRAVFIFIKPPTFDELKHRLRRRSTESDVEITRRLDLAKKEMSHRFVREYDYVVLNDKIAKGLDKLKEIVKHERERK